LSVVSERRNRLASAAAGLSLPAVTLLLCLAFLAAAPARADRIYWNDELASALIGKSVMNRRGEGLGEIADIVVDLKSGTARYALIESGGFLGLFETVRAFPFVWLAPGKRDDAVMLDVASGELDAAGRAPPPGLRASALIGATVYDLAGREAGEVRDLVVNLGDGRLRHAVIGLKRPEWQVTIEPEMLSASARAVVVHMRYDDLQALVVP
jgi:sporulation protein YlmC with PRC-barrel domain